MVKVLGIQLTQRTFLICLIVLLMLAIGYKLYKFRKLGAISICSQDAIQTFIRARNAKPNASIATIHPTNVVIEPWEGRHNIFAVFQVPDGFQPDQSFIVMVNEVPYCGAIEPTYRDWNDPFNPPSHAPQAVLGKFRTRTSLWLITKGQGEELKQPQNWWLVITKRS